MLGPHSGFVKGILQLGFTQIGLEDWNTCASAMGRVADLTSWLRREGEAGIVQDVGITAASAEPLTAADGETSAAESSKV
jgi:hypothetical protein